MSVTEFANHEYTTAAALEEKKKLRKHFTRFDIFFFLLCTIVGVDTLGQIASEGPQGFFWLMFLALFFFVPYGLLVAELGSTFPEEGGPYVWTRMAFGRKVAGLNSIFFWFSNPVWIGATLALLCIAAVQNYWFAFENGSIWEYVIGLGYVWFSVWSAILSFGVGKWIPTIGAFSRIALISLFSISTLAYGAQEGLNVPSLSEFSPTWPGFIALVPILFFNLVGFEMPSAAGDEMKNPQRDVPVAVIRSMITSILLYGLPILAIICVIPSDQIAGTGVSAFLDAIETVYTVWGGAGHTLLMVTVFFFIMALASSASAWLMGADRTEAIAAIDGTGPAWLGRFSDKYGTPVNVNVVSGLVSTIALVAALRIGNGSVATAFNVVVGIVLLFTTLSYIVIFPSVIKLRMSHAHAHRPYRIPGGKAGVWIAGCLTTMWAVLASLAGIFPGMLSNGQLLDDSALPEGVSRAMFTSYALGAIGITLLVGIWFYALGAPVRRQLVADPEVPVEPAPHSHS